MPFSGTEILVQGIIDCCFREEDGGWVILDYKTNRMPLRAHTGEAAEAWEQEMAAQYREQLRLYKEALESAWSITVKECRLYLLAADKSLLIE